MSVFVCICTYCDKVRFDRLYTVHTKETVEYCYLDRLLAVLKEVAVNRYY